jgi:23S rRNA (cytosine1962-C5)-methyltransferase
VDAHIGYELLDVSEHRRIERFGGRVVDRPIPGVPDARARRGGSAERAPADLRWDRDGGWSGDLTPWTLRWLDLELELRPTAAGQVGVFPEHAARWPAFAGLDGAEVLHLFAYTGATTLALARAGARVTHVDAARPSVTWARRNAELSHLADRPIRWIVDDAATFVGRETRRGRRYDAVVLDPPSYGHGPAGRAWRLADDLATLLAAVARLTGPAPALALLTAHTPGWDGDRLADELRTVFPGARATGAGELAVEGEAGRRLALGAWAAREAGA